MHLIDIYIHSSNGVRRNGVAAPGAAHRGNSPCGPSGAAGGGGRLRGTARGFGACQRHGGRGGVHGFHREGGQGAGRVPTERLREPSCPRQPYGPGQLRSEARRLQVRPWHEDDRDEALDRVHPRGQLAGVHRRSHQGAVDGGKDPPVCAENRRGRQGPVQDVFHGPSVVARARGSPVRRRRVPERDPGLRRRADKADSVQHGSNRSLLRFLEGVRNLVGQQRTVHAEPPGQHCRAGSAVLGT